MRSASVHSAVPARCTSVSSGTVRRASSSMARISATVTTGITACRWTVPEATGCALEPSATTLATARVSVWVSDTWKRLTPLSPGQRCRRRAQSDMGRTVGSPHHFDIAQGGRADARPHGLEHGLLGGETHRQARRRVRARRRVGLLGLGEHPRGQSGTPGQHAPEAVHIDGVDAEADYRHKQTRGPRLTPP